MWAATTVPPVVAAHSPSLQQFEQAIGLSAA